jgi:hypothetical protein
MSYQVMEPDKFADWMQKIVENSDSKREMHERMDDLMCALLLGFGYEKGVMVFRDTEKWYS